MSNVGWLVLENIIILAAICFLVWFTGSAWWVLLIVFMNRIRGKL